MSHSTSSLIFNFYYRKGNCLQNPLLCGLLSVRAWPQPPGLPRLPLAEPTLRGMSLGLVYISELFSHLCYAEVCRSPCGSPASCLAPACSRVLWPVPLLCALLLYTRLARPGQSSRWQTHLDLFLLPPECP